MTRVRIVEVQDGLESLPETPELRTHWSLGIKALRVFTRADRRWQGELIWAENAGGRVLAYIPRWRVHESTLPVQYRQIAGFQRFAGSLLLGSTGQMHCSVVFCAEMALDEKRDVARELLSAAARDVRLWAPFVQEHQAELFRAGASAVEVIGGAHRIECLGDEDAFIRALPRSPRQLMRRDVRRIAATGLRSVADSSPARPEEREAALISQSKARHGIAEPEKLTRYRLETWVRAVDRPVKFSVFMGDELISVAFGCAQPHGLSMYEIGLNGDTTCSRDAYLEALFHAPLRFCWAHGIERLELGSGSDEAKRMHGASMHTEFLFAWTAHSEPS